MLPVVTRPHIPETEIKQNCRRSAETKSRPSAVMFYFSFISPCATGLRCWILMTLERGNVLRSAVERNQHGSEFRRDAAATAKARWAISVCSVRRIVLCLFEFRL